jgi:hypothetical protein
MSPPPANPYTQTKGKGYRVLTRNNPNLRNRTLVSKNNIPPPPPPPPIALPHAILNSEHFDALDADGDGLLSMQARLDDHEKVLEKLLLVMQDLTAGQVPNGFRQPKQVN